MFNLIVYTLTLVSTVSANQFSSNIGLVPVQQFSSHDARFFSLDDFNRLSTEDEQACEVVHEFNPELFDCIEVQSVDLNEFACIEETDFSLFDCRADLEDEWVCEEEINVNNNNVPPPSPTGGVISNIPLPTQATVNQIPPVETPLPGGVPVATAGAPGTYPTAPVQDGVNPFGVNTAAATAAPTISSDISSHLSSLLMSLVLLL